MSSTGIINITVPRKNTKPGNSNLSDAGYIELKIKAPRKLHKVSRDAVAENSAPESERTLLLLKVKNAMNLKGLCREDIAVNFRAFLYRSHYLVCLVSKP